MNARTVPQAIYCDESGFTGSNLLDKEQPFYTYGSVALDEHTCSNVIERIRRELRLTSDEVKSKTLLKTKKGKALITEFFEKHGKEVKVVVFDKEYATACKFYEYVFEPVLSSQNSIFYSIGFHRFISNIVYFAFKVGDVDRFLSEFQQYVLTQDDSGLFALVESILTPQMDRVLEMIRTFICCHKQKIDEEVAIMHDAGLGKWSLDLTIAALFVVLTEWGEQFRQMEVYCDRSAPIVSNQEIFKVMIGREEKKYIDFAGRISPILFNLADEIKLVDSKAYPGIQLADIAAGAVAHMFKEQEEEFSKEWRSHIPDICCNGSVVPTEDAIDLTKKQVQLNAMLLTELTDRSVRGQSLLKDIGPFIMGVKTLLSEHPLQLED